MIRINLLGVERQKARKSSAGSAFDLSQQRTLLCSLIFVAAALGIGWWYWSLGQASVRVDSEITSAQQEAARLRSLLTEVQGFEARRAQLQQRVSLIERLRSGQSIPVQLLDHVSRSLPDMLWLTQVEQDGAKVTIQGRSTTHIGVSDFVTNLGNSALIQKPIDIVKSQAETGAMGAATATPDVELIQFTVRAQVAVAPVAGAKPPGAR